MTISGTHVGNIYEGDQHTFGQTSMVDGRVIGYFPCRICGGGMLGQRVYAHRNFVGHVECVAEIARAWGQLGPTVDPNPEHQERSTSDPRRERIEQLDRGQGTGMYLYPLGLLYCCISAWEVVPDLNRMTELTCGRCGRVMEQREPNHWYYWLIPGSLEPVLRKVAEE